MCYSTAVVKKCMSVLGILAIVCHHSLLASSMRRDSLKSLKEEHAIVVTHSPMVKRLVGTQPAGTLGLSTSGHEFFMAFSTL